MTPDRQHTSLPSSWNFPPSWRRGAEHRFGFVGFISPPHPSPVPLLCMGAVEAPAAPSWLLPRPLAEVFSRWPRFLPC